MSLLIRHWPYMVYLPSCHSTLRKKRCAKLKNVFVRVILPQIWYTTRAPFQKKPSPRYDHYDVHAHMATSEKCYNIYITVSSVLKKRTSNDDNFQLRHTDYSSKWPPLFCMQNSSHIKIQYDIILKIFYSFSSRCQETAWFTALFILLSAIFVRGPCPSFSPMTRHPVTPQDMTEYHYDQSNRLENSY